MRALLALALLIAGGCTRATNAISQVGCSNQLSPAQLAEQARAASATETEFNTALSKAGLTLFKPAVRQEVESPDRPLKPRAGELSRNSGSVEFVRDGARVVHPLQREPHDRTITVVTQCGCEAGQMPGGMRPPTVVFLYAVGDHVGAPISVAYDRDELFFRKRCFESYSGPPPP